MCARRWGTRPFHSAQQIEIFLHRSVAERALFAEAAVFVRFVRRHVVNVGFPFLH
jgi:hypothetical protein